MPLADAPSVWLFLPASYSWQLWLYYLGAAWLLVWGGHFLLRLASGRYEAQPWPWHRLLGLVLVLFPFIQLTYGVIRSIPVVIDTESVARTIPEAAWWGRIRRSLTTNLLVPFVGLLLASGLLARLDPARAAGFMRRVLDDVGMWPRRSWTHDAATGCALAVVIFFGYIGLAYLLSPLQQRDTGDASQVFLAITLPLAFALAGMAAITEEFLYRGLLVIRARAFFPRLATPLVVIAAAFVFGLAHAGYGTIANMLFPFLFGIMMGILALWVGVWPAVIVHFFVNLMIFLSILFRQGHPVAGPLLDAMLVAFVVFPAIYFGIGLLLRMLRRPGSSAPTPAATHPPGQPSPPVAVTPHEGRNA